MNIFDLRLFFAAVADIHRRCASVGNYSIRTLIYYFFGRYRAKLKRHTDVAVKSVKLPKWTNDETMETLLSEVCGWIHTVLCQC